MRSPGAIRLSLAGLLLIPLLLAFPGSGTSHASIVRSLNIEELTSRADRIFSGRVLNVRVVRDPELDRLVTVTTFRVDRAAKGSPGDRLTIRTLNLDGAGPGPGRGGQGAPRFQKGEEVVLFLYGDSELGLTSPVGFGQGKFSIVRDKTGRRLAINGLGNRNLLRGLSPRAEGRAGPSAKAWNGKPALPEDLVLDLAASLTDPPVEGKARRGGPRP